MRWYNTMTLCTCPVLVHYSSVLNPCRDQSELVSQPCLARVAIERDVVRWLLKLGHVDRVHQLVPNLFQLIFQLVAFRQVRRLRRNL